MKLIVIAHNIRSAYNVGAILRSCDGFGVDKVWLTGYTPYPTLRNDDERPPHIRAKLTHQIHKTALGAESTLPLNHSHDPLPVLRHYQRAKAMIAALEQTDNSIMLPSFRQTPNQLVLILGEEVHGIPIEILKVCNIALEIPMQGKKESFNVSVATGIALYAIRQL